MPLSTIFHLYRDGQFCWCWKNIISFGKKMIMISLDVFIPVQILTSYILLDTLKCHITSSISGTCTC